MLKELGYFVIGTPRPADWTRFALDILGMQGVAGTWLRMDQWSQRITLLEQATDALVGLGWAVKDPRELKTFRDLVEAVGTVTVDGSQEDCRQRMVSQFFWFTDPGGNRHEVFSGRTMAGTPFQSPIAGHHFVTGALGAGHAVLSAGGKFDETIAFWDAIGCFQLTDFDYKEAAEGQPARRTRFYRCNARHHSIAYADFPATDFGCHHIMIELATLDALGMLSDRAAARGDVVASTLGRHVNDEMVSIYLQTPGGFAIEVGTGARLIEGDHEAANFAVANSWGHHWQKPWVDKLVQSLKH